MNAPPKVLFITYSFPPEAEIGGKRAARFCRYLPEFGIQPTVLTVDPKFYEAIDASYLPPPGLEIIRTGALNHPLDWYRKLTRRMRGDDHSHVTASSTTRLTTAEGRNSNLLRTIRENLLAALQRPDRCWGWYWQAVTAGVRFVRENKPVAMVSSGPPWTSHLVARGIHRKTRVPWVADFRDPWTLSPWRDRIPGWIERLEQRLERSLIVESDRVVCVADEIADDFRALYPSVPKDKFITITNGIEGEITVPDLAPPGAKRLLLHLGSLYGDRRIRPLLRAAVNLVRSGRFRAESLHFLFVGLIDPEIVREASEEISYLEQFGAIELRDRVPYDEGQRLLASADLLLLLQGNNRATVPGKLFEYLTVGKPILVIAKPGSLTRLVRESDLGSFADSDDVDAIAAEFLKCLQLPPRTPAEFDRIVQQFHFRTLTKRLIEVIQLVSR